MNKLINLLSNSGYIIVNKEIIKKIGLHEAVVLGELCSEYTYWEREKKLDDNFFYSTRENIENETGLSPYQQRIAIDKLVKIGILICKKYGMPQKVWYSFDEKMMYKLFIENEEIDFTPSSEETSHQDVKKLDDKESKNLTPSDEEILYQDVKKIDINNNKNNNNKNNNKEREEKKAYAEKVYLFESEYNSLIDKYFKNNVDNIIQELNLYKKSTGKTYEDDYATLVRWLNREKEKNKSKFNYEQRNYDNFDWSSLYANNQWTNS